MDQFSAVTQENRYAKWFWYTLFGSLVIKIFLAIYFPLTGDEAYFAIWGKFFSLGYYDHTPLIGWILWLFVHMGCSNLVLRLPTLITTFVLGLVVYFFLKPYDPKKAALIAILYLISPINLGGVLVTTDIPLILFSVLSGLALFAAVKRNDHLGFYILAGIFLGLAFFSKYFAVLLALAYIVYFLCVKKSWKRTLGFALLFACVLPFGIENIYWNYYHGWANIVFNLFTRNRSASFHWDTLGLYILIVIYILTPAIFYYFCKHIKLLFKRPREKYFGLFAAALFVPLFFFLLLSTIKSIGLHWPLSFVPFAYLLLLVYLSQQEIIRSIKFMCWFTGLHLLILVVALALPMKAWHHLGFHGHKYADLVFIARHPEVRQVLNKYENNYVIASPSYAKADLMYIDSNVYSPTFGTGSVHGREGDFLTDFRTMKHKDFVIFMTKQPDLQDFKPYFKRLKTSMFDLYGAKFYLVFGYDFNYDLYRDKILRTINQRYWQVPDVLPHAPTPYYLKYFANEDQHPKS